MKKLLIPCLALVALALGCNKSNFEQPEIADHTAEFAFPLFNTELKVSDLVDNILQENTTGDTIIVNADNTLTLFYSGDVTESKATDIFQFFADQLPLAVDSSYFEVPVKTPDGVALYRADLSGGNIFFVIKNTMTEPIDIRFYIPQLSKNGQIFEYAFQDIPAGGQATIPAVDLKDWVINTSNNLITFRYEAFLQDGTPILRLPANGGIPAIFGLMQQVTFTYLEGYWGKVEYGLSTETIDIDINQTNLTGNVQVKNPKVTITVFNSFGFPTRGLIKYLRFVAKNGDLLELESPLIQEGTEIGIDFAYPSFAAGEVGQTKETVFYFDETNSNIAEIFNSEPVQMIYQVNGLANADDNQTLVGFLTDSSSVRMNVKVELLLEGSLKDFAADQTLALDFSQFSDADSPFDEAEFKLVTENTMGLTTNLQVYFLDVNAVAVDSLFSNGPQDVIKAGPIDPATGITTGSTRTETFIPFTADRFNRLRKDAKSAYLKTAFTSANDGTVPVKILANQSAVVKMGVRVKTKI